MYEIFEQLLKKHDVTPYRVHKQTGVAQSTLSDWKNNKGTPKAESLKKIAEYFGVTIDYLMGNDAPSSIGSNVSVIDEDNNPIVLDDETLEYIDSLRSRPEMKMLFSVSKKATKEDIIKAVKIIEALKDESK